MKFPLVHNSNTTITMSKNAAKRRAGEEEGTKDAVSPLEIPQLSEQQQKLVQAQAKCVLSHSYDAFGRSLAV